MKILIEMKTQVFVAFIGILALISACANVEKEKDISKNKKTLLAVVAHADDELFISPILAKYAEEGHQVYLMVVTKGEKGVKSHAHIPAGDSLAKVRAQEVLCTAQTLGINPPILLEYPDGELNSWDNIFSLDDKIDSVFQLLKPDVIVTWGAEGGYGHPDHRMVSNIVTEVFQKGKLKHSNLLYYGLTQSVLDSLVNLKTVEGVWFKENMHPTTNEFLTYRIPYRNEHLNAGKEAFECNKSQFIHPVMDEIYMIVAETDSVMYLRPWFGSNSIKTDLFDSPYESD